MEGASLERAEWDIPRGTEQMVKDQPSPIWDLIPPSCNEGSPGVLRDHSLGKQRAQVEHCQHPAGSCSPARGLTTLLSCGCR